MSGLAELFDALPGQKAGVEHMKGMLDKQLSEIDQLQSALLIDAWRPGVSLDAVRRANIPRFPLRHRRCFFEGWVARARSQDAQALPTEVPRADDVRNYLRHELEAAYDLLEHYQCDVFPIARLVAAREDRDSGTRHSR